jgi:hypothetical protein
MRMITSKPTGIENCEGVRAETGHRSPHASPPVAAAAPSTTDQPEGTTEITRPAQEAVADNYDLIAPLREGPFLIGCCDRINGPSSAKSTVAISRFEAGLLVRHWAEEHEATERTIAAEGGVSGDDSRLMTYAAMRVSAMRDAGLLSDEECRIAWRQPYEEHKAFWDDFRAAGGVLGFAVNGGAGYDHEDEPVLPEWEGVRADVARADSAVEPPPDWAGRRRPTERPAQRRGHGNSP